MSRKLALTTLIVALATSATILAVVLRGGPGSSGEVLQDPAATETSDPGTLIYEAEAVLPHLHQLNKNYFRGSQPLKGGVTVLKRLGIHAVVDLRSAYDHSGEIRAAAERAGLRYYWNPMSVWDPPTDTEANEFLLIVMDESKGPFFVFCSDGLNRVGELSAIYRIMNDKWTVEQALEEMDALGFNPYYYSLRNYVWTYARKFRPSAVPQRGRRISPIEKWEATETEKEKRKD